MKEWLKALIKAIGTLLLISIIIGLIVLGAVILISIIIGLTVLVTTIVLISYIYILNKFGIIASLTMLVCICLIYKLTHEYHNMAVIDKKIADKRKYERKRENMLANLFLTPWTVQNRDMVRNQKSKGREYSINSMESYIGHIYDNAGRYQAYYLAPGIDNIARFICCNNQDKFLTSEDDVPVLTAIGKFLDLCCIPEMEKDKLVTLLGRYQEKDTKFDCNKE